MSHDPTGSNGASVSVDLDVPARMRDGVALRANVYRPGGSGPWPTLLARTPYSKDDQRQHVWCGLDPVQAARRGFLVVVQDVRGRFASGGAWDPFRFEHEDGYDTVEWAARLPGSNGRVGMYSASYCASTQWLAAAERPPSLAAISPALTWSDPLDGLFARGGAVELGVALRWALENGFDSIRRLGLDDDERRRRAGAVIDAWDRLGEAGYWDLPVNDIAVLRGLRIPELGGIRALDDPAVAERCRVTGLYDRFDVPSFHTAGWYDIFVQGTLDNYAAMARAGREARLIVGPWTHETFADPIGERLFGMRAGRDGVPVHADGDWNDLQLAWFRRQLDPAAGVELPEAPVRIFVMGRNVWRDEPGWPPERAVEQRWYLRADGSLTSTGPEPGERPSVFVYDPGNPVPTAGGHGVMSPGDATGPVDQAAVEARDDVLVFTSEPLREELEVTGRVRVVLHAESSAPSTDWVVRLCDVHPDGRSFNLCDGIVRVGERAHECARHELDLWSTSNVFLRGHRLRVHVTSSSFPRWDRNLNTGDQREPRHAVARQRVTHDAERPSYVVLPVIAAPAR
jgi:putative CocE/NonD family hydrolase